MRSVPFVRESQLMKPVAREVTMLILKIAFEELLLERVILMYCQRICGKIVFKK